ncbi:hypothetical protein DOTSEDRAFT_29899 [Dothistroma septosporum NZE10]|uniref:Uncharacterized protein n=1 Tax=Dothistroma septosporum (strain NZE10 / CBS 128990) TaxID=675120 RepID=N1Q1E0_DOTSN|nr:hypothetical protein DOTSEDRAFT_29899 [Dothistroma septosporum NZE10]
MRPQTWNRNSHLTVMTMSTGLPTKEVSTSSNSRPVTSPSSTPTKTLSESSNSSNPDASFDSWLNIQNGKIFSKPQPNHIVDPKRQSSFDDSDSDLSGDEELVETMPCGTKKLHPQMEDAVASFIEKQKAKGQGEGRSKEERGRSWRRRRDGAEGSGRSGHVY